MKKETGITLVALVVTIVVLLILAGVTITILIGDNGIIKKAQDAADATNAAVEDELQGMDNLVDKINSVLSGGTGKDIPPTVEKPKVADNLGKVINETKNTDLVDAYENKITIPAGFHIVTPSEDNTVKYTYSGDEVPAVQDGIVIEDNDGNQFVWIPVGTIKNREGDINGTTTTIELARYTFDIIRDVETDTISGGTGAIKEKITDGSLLEDEWIEKEGEGYLEEISTSTTYSNTKAKDIEGFKTSAKTKGGYYLARYEASYRDGTRPYSKPSTGDIAIEETTQKTEGMLWNFITQPEAATVSRNMYTNDNFESDLINSYSWDTAIVFIQTYSGNTDYSMQTSVNKDISNTGINGDQECNINDMSSNMREWSTETYTNSSYPCGTRGGLHYYPNEHTAFRYHNLSETKYVGIAFRPLLYLN